MITEPDLVTVWHLTPGGDVVKVITTPQHAAGLRIADAPPAAVQLALFTREAS